MDVIDLTRKLVQIPSLSGQEGQVANFIETSMKELGFFSVEIDHLGSVIGIAGDRDQRPILLFDGHMDIVPPNGNWKHDPFSGLIENGHIYGRGSSDMKGGLAAAIIGVSEAIKTGKLKKTVAVSATVLEEVMGGLALGEVCDKVNPEMVVICESTALELFAGQRGRIEFFVDIFGEPVHTKLADKNSNALVLASKAINTLSEIDLPEHASYGKASLVPIDIISNPYPSISITPKSIHIRIERRTIFSENLEEVTEQISDAIRSSTELPFEIRLVNDPITTYTGEEIQPPRVMYPFFTDQSHRLIENIIQSMEKLEIPVKTGRVFPGCTNGSASAGIRAIPTVIIGPGLDAHNENESAPIKEIINAKDLYRELTLKFAGA